MNAQEIYALPKDQNGWRRLKNCHEVYLGNNARIGDNVDLGDGVCIGNNVDLGDGVCIGDNVYLGNDIYVGDGVRLNDRVCIGNNVYLGDRTHLGEGVRLVEGVELYGSDKWELSPLQLIGTRAICYEFGSTGLAIGCERHSIDYWLKNYRRIGESKSYSAREIAEYKRHIEYFEEMLTTRCQRRGIN